MLLARVLHDFYDQAALSLLRTAAGALKDGGRLAVVELSGVMLRGWGLVEGRVKAVKVEGVVCCVRGVGNVE